MNKVLTLGTCLLVMPSMIACSKTVGTTSKVMTQQAFLATTQNAVRASSRAKKSAQNMTSVITEADVAWSKAIGNNTVYGSAVIQSLSYGNQIAQTCEGKSVKLIPKTAYSDERMNYYYGNLKRGHLDLTGPIKKKRGEWSTYGKKSPAAKKGILAGDDNPIYTDSIRVSYCDQRGDFVFDNLPDGEYYVTGSVKWGYNTSGWRPNDSHVFGGLLMQYVKVAGGIRQRVILSSSK